MFEKGWYKRGIPEACGFLFLVFVDQMLRLHNWMIKGLFKNGRQ